MGFPGPHFAVADSRVLRVHASPVLEHSKTDFAECWRVPQFVYIGLAFMTLIVHPETWPECTGAAGSP